MPLRAYDPMVQDIKETDIANQMKVVRKKVQRIARDLKIKPLLVPYKYMRLYSRSEAERIKKASKIA